MRTEPNFTRDGRTPTVYIPISIRRRGGSKLVLAPDGTNDTWAAPCRRIDKAMLKTIARVFQRRDMWRPAPTRPSPRALTPRRS